MRRLSDNTDVIVIEENLYCYISWEEGDPYAIGQETKRSETNPRSQP